MDKKIKAQEGFSLIELMIAIVILGIILIVTMGFFKNSLTMRTDSKGSESAYLLGQEKIVELKAMAVPSDSSDTVDIDKKKYTRNWTIIKASGSSLLSQITVTVNYKVGARTLSIKCYGGVN